MAVLTRPLFHAQERIDLEDLNQLLSGLRTDSKLYVREVLGEEENYILSGFNASGLSTPQLTVDILGASMLFAGKQDPAGTTNITINTNGEINASAVISFTLDDGRTITFARQDTTPDPLAGEWAVGATALDTAVNIRNAIVGKAPTEFVSASNPIPTSGVVNLTTLVQGFINIQINNASGFQNLSDTVLNIFDYTGSVIESPSDLSWWTIHADATSSETKLTQPITSQFRAPSGTAVRTLIVYAKLVTEEATPITKAFWDPSANSGSGAEFNQRVNTAVDLAVELNLQDAPLSGSELFANTEICRIDVDGSGTILAIRDTRSLYFEGVDSYPWERTAPFATITTLSTQVTDGTAPAAAVAPTGTLRLLEPIVFLPIGATSPSDTPLATSRIVSTDGATDPELGIEKFDLSAIQGTYNTIIVGQESGARRIVNTISSNFIRDDKSITNFKEFVDAVTTGIRQAKGTDNWFDDVDGNVQDALKFINSNIIGESDLAAYRWIPGASSDPSATGTLSILASPAVLFEIDFTAIPAVGITAAFGGATGAPTTTLRTFTSVAESTTTLPAGSWRIGTSITESAINLAEAITDFNFGLDGNSVPITVRAVANGASVVITSDTRNQFISGAETAIEINIAGTGTLPTVARMEDGAAVTDNDLIAIRIFNDIDKFLLRGQDITIRPNNVLYITLPEKDSRAGARYSYNGVVDYTTEIANQPNYNNTDPIFGELNNPNFANSFVGRLKTIPIGDFVNDGRNYWIAVTESGATGSDTLLHVRGVGQLNANQFTPVGAGVTNETITYIGASGTSDSTPDYPSVTAINAFTEDGAYEVESLFNTTVIAQSENLTAALSDINNHLVTLKNIDYQDKGLKLVAGGYWTWLATSSTLSITDDAFIQIPGIALNTNTISMAAFNLLANGTTTTLDNGQVITATVNRIDGTGAQNVVLAKEDIDAVVPGRDKFIIARRIGSEVYVGTPSAMALTDGDTSPLDGALSYFGLKGGNGQLPRQLKTVLGDQTTAKNIDIETSDVLFQLGGFAPNDIITTDDEVTLTLPIGTGILQWEGAEFEVPQTGTAGLIKSVSTGTPVFRNRMQGASGTSFSLPSIPNGSSVWMGISISDGGIISDDGNTDNTYFQSLNLSNFFGRIKGEPNVQFGNVSAVTNDLVFSEFGGDIPVVQIKLTRDLTTGFINDINGGDDVVVLGAAGGGGGGTGNANQDLNNYLNRLNLAPYSYLSPIVAATASFNDVLNTSETDAITSSTGITFNVTNTDLVTADLIDNDFKNGDQSISKVEVMSFWGIDETTELPTIDPSARWFVTQDPENTTVDPTFLTTHALSSAATLTVASVDIVNDTITVLNHGLSTGQFVTANLIGASIGGTAPFIRVLDIDTLAFYSTVPDADANTNRASITGTFTSGTVDVSSGFINRVDSTETVRGSYTFENPLLTGQVTFTAVATGMITIALLDENGNAANQSFTLSGASTTALATNLAASINSAAGATRRTTAEADGVSVFIYTESSLGTENALATTAVSGITDRIMSSFAVFYKYDEGLTGVPSNGLEDISDILRSNHLANSTDPARGYGQAGRGIVLVDGGGTTTEIAVDNIQRITVNDVAVPALPLGTVVDSVLTETLYNSVTSGDWVLCDGRSISGSALATLASMTNAPNFIGRAAMMAGTANAQFRVNAFASFVNGDTIVYDGITLTASDSDNTLLNFEFVTDNSTTAANIVSAFNRNKARTTDGDATSNGIVVTFPGITSIVATLTNTTTAGAVIADLKPLNNAFGDTYQSHRHTLTLGGREQAAGGNQSPAWQYEPAVVSGRNLTTTATMDDDRYGTGTPIDNSPAGSGSYAVGSGGSTVGGDSRFGAETRPAAYSVNKFIRIN